MKLGSLLRLGALMDATKEQVKAAEPGDVVETEAIKGVRLWGRRGRLWLCYQVEE